MANTRGLSYWWANGWPTKWGLAVPHQNYEETNPVTPSPITASQYFNTKFFSVNQPGVNSFDSTVYPYHGVVAPFYNWKFDFLEGWQQTNWKTAMYLPMLFMPVTTHPTYTQFKALLAQYPNKPVLIGNEPNDVNQGRVTPQQFVDALDDLRTVAPNMKWIGPNIIEPFGELADDNRDNVNASCNTNAWISHFRNLILLNPARAPWVYSFHIYPNSVADWSGYYKDLCLVWMDRHTETKGQPIWVTETCISRVGATAAEQQQLLATINSKMYMAGTRLAMTFMYCAVDDKTTNIAGFTNNELEAWSSNSYAYTSVGQDWDDRVTYWSPGQKRPWAAPRNAPAAKRAAFPLLSPAL